MPRINITEVETAAAKILNPTENTVLIPLVCKAGTDDTAKKYSYATKSQFSTDFGANVVTETVGTSSTKEKSYTYAYMLLAAGMSVVIKPIIAPESSEISEPYTEDYLTQVVNAAIVANKFSEFTNKNIYNLKFITTGAHANITRVATSEGTVLSGCYKTLAQVAYDRGDAIALVELEESITSNSASESDYILSVLAGSPDPTVALKHAACVFPWGSYQATDGLVNYANITLPGSYGYLAAFANSVQTNADYLAAAGVVRGAIPGLNKPLCEVGESLMHNLLNETQTHIVLNVNPIMSVSEYGYKIWGNKTALFSAAEDSYQNFLNVRILLCNIKKQIYFAATRYTFEPNDMITWLNFTKKVNELLDVMQANRGIEWYSWRRQETTAKATIKAVLTIKPIEAVEYFDIELNLTSEETTVSEI